MYVVRVHLSRPVKVKGKARGPRLEISSLWREVDFVSTSVLGGQREGVPMPLNL